MEQNHTDTQTHTHTHTDTHTHHNIQWKNSTRKESKDNSTLAIAPINCDLGELLKYSAKLSSRLWELAMDREAWHAAIYGVVKSHI